MGFPAILRCAQNDELKKHKQPNKKQPKQKQLELLDVDGFGFQVDLKFVLDGLGYLVA